MRVASVVLHGTVAVTTPALHALLEAGVPVVLLRRDGRALGRLEPPGSSYAERRHLQVKLSADPERSLRLARRLVSGRIANQRALLARRYRRRDTNPWVLAHLAGLSDQALEAPDIARLMGLEGAAARAYFGAVRALLPAWCRFERRDRAGGDVIYAAVNYCSALLREALVTALWYRRPFRAGPRSERFQMRIASCRWVGPESGSASPSPRGFNAYRFPQVGGSSQQIYNVRKGKFQCVSLPAGGWD